MKNVFLIFLGGGLGSVLRYGFTKYLNPVMSNFFLGTFSANIVACFLLGLFTGLYFKEADKDFVKHFVLIGICGGFSTYSAFAFDFIKINNSGEVFNSMLYVLLSLVVGILAVVFGMGVGQRI